MNAAVPSACSLYASVLLHFYLTSALHVSNALLSNAVTSSFTIVALSMAVIGVWLVHGTFCS